MSHSLRAYLLSFVLHGGIFLFTVFLSGSFHRTREPLEVDLSLVEFEGAPHRQEPERITYRVPEERAESSYERLTYGHAEKQESEPQEVKQEALGETTSKPSETNMEKSAPLTEPSQTPFQGAHSSMEKPNADTTGNSSSPPDSTDKVISAPEPSSELQGELYLKEKLATIRQILQKNISYPPLARRMGWEGRVVLAIRIGEDGSLREVRVLESSGYELLDKNAVDTVKRVWRLFPKPPVEVVVKLPVDYILE